MSEIDWLKEYGGERLIDRVKYMRENRDLPAESVAHAWFFIAGVVRNVTGQECSAEEVEAAYHEHGCEPDADANIAQAEPVPVPEIDWHQRLQETGLPLSEFVKKWHGVMNWEQVATCISMVTDIELTGAELEAAYVGFIVSGEAKA